MERETTEVSNTFFYKIVSNHNIAEYSNRNSFGNKIGDPDKSWI